MLNGDLEVVENIHNRPCTGDGTWYWIGCVLPFFVRQIDCLWKLEGKGPAERSLELPMVRLVGLPRMMVGFLR